MISAQIGSIERGVHETNAWLEDLSRKEPFGGDVNDAYSALRAVFHALRDRLTVEEAAHLPASMPMVLRGVYYEGWRPALAPNEEQTKEEFLDKVRQSLRDKAAKLPVEEASRAVCALLAERIPKGEIDDVRGQLPEPIRALFD